jgi:hypothetical protein
MTAGFREKALTPLFRFGVIFIVAAHCWAAVHAIPKLPRHVTSANCRGGMGYQ